MNNFKIKFRRLIKKKYVYIKVFKTESKQIFTIGQFHETKFEY